MVSDSCKKRFGKIMLEQMELLNQVEIAPNIFSMILKGRMVSQMQAGQFLKRGGREERKGRGRGR